MSRALAAHARGKDNQALAARLVEASSTLVPTDEGSAAVAPWVTEPIPAGALAESGVPLSRRHGSGSGPALVDGGAAAASASVAGGVHPAAPSDAGTAPGAEVPTVDTFLKAFGPIPHVPAAGPGHGVPSLPTE